jgi:hypothetical protein
MKEEYEKRLKEDFIFMKNGTHFYGQYECVVMDDWFDLIYAMCSEIQESGGDFIPVQIKQKYCRLRVYYKPGDEARIGAIVEKYEALSETYARSAIVRVSIGESILLFYVISAILKCLSLHHITSKCLSASFIASTL